VGRLAACIGNPSAAPAQSVKEPLWPHPLGSVTRGGCADWRALPSLGRCRSAMQSRPLTACQETEDVFAVANKRSSHVEDSVTLLGPARGWIIHKLPLVQRIAQGALPAA
jgi:hypothetical protein